MPVAEGVSFQTTLARRNDQGEKSNELSFSLSVNLDRNWNVSTRAESKAGQTLESFRVNRSIPNAEGAGGRLGIDHTMKSETLEGFAQYNSSVGSLSGSVRKLSTAGIPGNAGSELRLTGSLASIDGSLFATRQIDQSFSMIDVAGLPNVRVYQNNQFIGYTRADGKLLAPGLGAYTANQIRIDDRDIPMDIDLAQIVEVTVPRSLMGTLVRFPARKISAAGGRLMVSVSGSRQAVDSARIVVRMGDRLIESTTGPDGDFYLEELSPGDYSVLAESANMRCGTITVLP